MTSLPLTLAADVIKSVNWRDFELFAGPDVDFGLHLAAFLSDGHPAARADLWTKMESRVFLQDDIASAAEPTIAVLCAALVDPLPEPVKASVLDLLFHLVRGASLRNDNLGSACLAGASSAAWLLVREARIGSEWVAEACREILELCAPECVAWATPRR
jgi:hypothetical protein